MFEVFGEFDSVEELNECAAGLLAEGDTESLVKLAEENGIDKEDAEDYADGVVEELANPLIAALGKISVEEKELKPQDIMVDWVNYIKTKCAQQEEVARAVRKKGKTIKGCIGEILKYSFKIQHPVDKDIIKAAGINAGKVTLGIPGMVKVREIIDTYYLGK